jgi:hypothetical protein
MEEYDQIYWEAMCDCNDFFEQFLVEDEEDD